MTRLLSILVLCALLTAATACGGGKTPPPPAGESPTAPSQISPEYAAEDGEPQYPEEAAENEEETEPLAKPNSLLQSLKIPDKPRYGEAVKAQLTHQEIPSELTLVYRWWVNDEEITDLEEEDTLPAGNTRPKDWLFCLVELLDEEDNTVQTLRSNRVTVLPLPPETRLDPLPSFSVPGEFVYQLKAIDPNEPEDGGNETLSYELVEPQSENIVIDRQSGLLRWMIDMETAKRLEEGMTISFRVFSSWGTSVTGSFTLRVSPQEGEGDSEED